MFHDIYDKRANYNNLDQEILQFDKIQEFGDPYDKEFYETMKMISPYHMPTHDKYKIGTEIYLTVDESHPYKYHA